MKASDLIITARNAGLSEYGKIKYNNDYPYNVMKYNYPEQYWTCDCLGFVHTMINGFCGDKSILGGGAVMDDFVNYSDEITTITKYCYDQSSDFNYILPGEILYMPGHVGLYIGEYTFADGRKFNVAECCYSSFGGGGMLTWVDPDGLRRNHYNGSSAGFWTKHGKCVRVDYDIESPDDYVIPEVTPQEILTAVNETFAGAYGNNPGRREKLVAKYGEKVYRQIQDIINILYK